MNTKTYLELEEENKKLLKAIQKCKSESYFKLLTENSRDGILIIDNFGKITYTSKSSERILGFLNEEMLGRNIFDKIYKDDKDFFGYEFAEIVKNNKEEGSIKLRVYNKDGKLVYLDGNWQNMLDYPEVQGIVINYRDVTEKIEIENALIKSEQNYKSIINNLTDAYYQADKNGKVVLASPSCMDMFGYETMDEVIGGDVSILYSNPEERSRFLNILKQNGKVKNFQAELTKADGTKIFVETSARILLDSDKNYMGVDGIVRDISDRKKIENDLILSEEKLKESNKAKDIFFSIIAHDLKSPFNVIFGFSDLLSEQFDTFEIEKQKRFISIIKESSENAYKLLENLLVWARAQQGEMKFSPTKESLHLLIYETIQLLKFSFKAKSITIENNISKDFFVNVDKDMVLTVLRNLINNAVKFTNRNGRILLSAELYADKKFVKIGVSDNGIGISSDRINKLFNISEKITTKGTDDETGTGLGLIICKEFIEKHDGKIWVESEVNVGSTFYFTLHNA